MVRLASAALSGWLLSRAFPPTGWWWVAIPALAVLFVGCYRRTPLRGFAIGLVFGAAVYIPLLDWISAVIGADAGIGLALYSAMWIGATGAGIALVSRLPLWWVWVPCVWVLQEAVSGRIPFGGWGWGRLGFSQDSSPLLPWAALAGVPGLSFVLVLSAAAAAEIGIRAAQRLGRDSATDQPTRRGPVRPATAAAVGLVAVWIAAPLIPVPTAAEDVAGPSTRAVGLIQGDVPQAGLDFNAQRRAVLDNHVRQTVELADDIAAGRAQQPDLVLWPENSSDIDPYRNADANAAIDSAAAAVGVPILVGAVVSDNEDPAKVYNQGVVWDPATGPGQAYTKRNLVPFGEYVPFRSTLSGLITRFERIPRDFVPGQDPGDLDIGGTVIGDALCFDVAYDDAMRDATRRGARMLVVQTNNATYNGTSQPAQQFAISRIRAVEHGRAVAVVSTSGLSGVIQPDGSLLDGTAIGELTSGRYVVTLPQRDTLTVADRLGTGPEWIAAGLGALALVVGTHRLRVTRAIRSQGLKVAGAGTIESESAVPQPKGRS